MIHLPPIVQRLPPALAVVLPLCLCLLLSLSVASAPLAAQQTTQPSAQQKAQPPADGESARAAVAARADRLEAYAHSFRYRDAALAAGLVRHKLSPRGTLEVQPSANTLVVRDIASILERIKPALAEFDSPPSKVRLELRVVKAGPRPVVSPPVARPDAPELPPDLLDKLQNLLRYDSYEVLAEASVSSLEGESVDYSLGPDYSVSFTIGSLLAQRRLRMEDFRIVERLSSDKGRGLDPKQLFHADLNLWMDRPFTLVLTRDEARQEALLVAITGYVEEEPAQTKTSER